MNFDLTSEGIKEFGDAVADQQTDAVHAVNALLGIINDDTMKDIRDTLDFTLTAGTISIKIPCHADSLCTMLNALQICLLDEVN